MRGLVIADTQTLKAPSPGTCSCGGVCILGIQAWYESNPKK